MKTSPFFTFYPHSPIPSFCFVSLTDHVLCHICKNLLNNTFFIIMDLDFPWLIYKKIYISTPLICVSAVSVLHWITHRHQKVYFTKQNYIAFVSQKLLIVYRGVPSPLKKVSHFSDPPIYNKVLSPYIFMNP